MDALMHRAKFHSQNKTEDTPKINKHFKKGYEITELKENTAKAIKQK